LGKVDQLEERVLGWRRLVAAYDVERQLERGYTLTLDGNGHVVRHARDVESGERLVTRFADGIVGSVVDMVSPREA
jgi:exonuclease VII large subunit